MFGISKKFFGLVGLAAFSLLLVSILTACGDNTTAPQNSAASVPTVAVTTQATTARVTTVAATTQAATTARATTVAATTQAATPATNSNAAANNEPVKLRFSEFYAPQSSPINLVFSDKLKSANGKRIQITGYMAPPLKPDLDFFVLTRIKLAVCPFCSTAADWPEDIMLVTMQDGKTIKQIEEPITIVGKLEIGDSVDPTTGFFSLLRLRAETIEVFKGS